MRTSAMLRRAALVTIGALLAIAPLAGCKVVAINDDVLVDSNAFDPVSYVDGLWAGQVLPHFATAARPLPDVLAAIAADLNQAGESLGHRPATEGSPWTFVVTGRGRVVTKNTQSRAGSLTVDVGGTEVAIQIGPVVRGNTVRDALPFVQFQDFTNQLEFAEVGKLMTGLAMAAVAPGVEAVAEGQEVSFTGAMSLNSKTDKILITPVELKAEP